MIDRSFNPQYANAIRNARRKRGLKQCELAKKLNVTNVYISLIENGKDKPSLKLVEQMADKLNFKLTINFDEWE